MGWFKRIGLFLVVNILVVTTVSVILNVLGVRPYLNAQGLDYASLAIFCLVWGMAGSFISLGLSRIMAKRMMGVRVIDPNTSNAEEMDLVRLVHGLSVKAGLPKMPEVGVYDSPEVNAFATGPTKARSLVAVSRGLLQKMNRAELEGVLGHEVAHIANGDMVTMTLLQGVVNAFVMFLARAIAFAIAHMGRDRDEEHGVAYGSYFIVQFILEIVFMILGSMVVAWFSRHREFKADAGGAGLAGRRKMIDALSGLRRNYELIDPRTQPALKSFKISNRTSGFMRLFSTHPPLEERIARLEKAVIHG